MTDTAACGAVDPDIFFPPSYSGSYRDVVRTAKALCAKCGIRPACLQQGLEVSRDFGIWGGTTPNERVRMAARRSIAIASQSLNHGAR